MRAGRSSMVVAPAARVDTVRVGRIDPVAPWHVHRRLASLAAGGVEQRRLASLLAGVVELLQNLQPAPTARVELVRSGRIAPAASRHVQRWLASLAAGVAELLQHLQPAPTSPRIWSSLRVSPSPRPLSQHPSPPAHHVVTPSRPSPTWESASCSSTTSASPPPV